LAALVFLLLEYFSNFRSEYTCIWRARPTVANYIYISSRYLGLIGQIVHHVLIHVFPIEVPVKPELCRVWYLFLFGVCAIALANLDAILLLRVYALYRKNTKVYILSVPIIVQFIVASVQMERVSRCHNFNPYCNKPTSLMDVGLAGGSVLLAHVAILLAIFAKRNVAEGRAAVVRLVVHEGAWIVSCLVGIVAAESAFAVVSDSSSPFDFFVWPSVLMSVTTCRIILNMNKLRIEECQQQLGGGIDSTECGLSTVELTSSCDNRNEEI